MRYSCVWQKASSTMTGRGQHFPTKGNIILQIYARAGYHGKASGRIHFGKTIKTTHQTISLENMIYGKDGRR